MIDIKETRRQYYLDNKEILNARSREYSKNNKERLNIQKKEYYLKNKEALKLRRNYYRTDPKNRIKMLAVGAKKRANKRKIEFQIGLADYLINTIDLSICACCGKALDYSVGSCKRNMDWPSLDRFNNQLGYTFENTKIICLGCNLAKKDSSAELLMLVAKYANKI